MIKNNAPSFFGKIQNPHNKLEHTIDFYSKKNIPTNAHETIYGWSCNEGFYQSGEFSCDLVPKHAHEVEGYNWTCNNGYKKINNYCEHIPQCKSSQIYDSTTNTCISIPINAIKLDNYSWFCDEGFYMDEQGAECLRSQNSEVLENVNSFAWNFGGSIMVPFTSSFDSSDSFGGQLYIGSFLFYNFEKFRIGAGLHYELNYICLSSPVKVKKQFNFNNENVNRHYLIHRLDLSLLAMYGNKVKFFAKPKISFNLYGNNEWTKIDSNNEIYSDVVIEWEIKTVSFEIDMGISVGSWNFYIGYTRPMVEDSFSKNYHSLLIGVSWTRY